jgi:hypothetical protein
MSGNNGTNTLHLHRKRLVREYHKTPDSVIERRLRILENRIAGLATSPEGAMKYYAEIGRLRGQYEGEKAYPANVKVIMNSIFMQAQKEFKKSNGKGELCKTPA